MSFGIAESKFFVEPQAMTSSILLWDPENLVSAFSLSLLGFTVNLIDNSGCFGIATRVWS